jgi:hypothetical protein
MVVPGGIPFPNTGIPGANTAAVPTEVRAVLDTVKVAEPSAVHVPVTGVAKGTATNVPTEAVADTGSVERVAKKRISGAVPPPEDPVAMTPETGSPSPNTSIPG